MFASNGYYAALQGATPGYTPTPWAPYPPTDLAGPGPAGIYNVGPWGRPMFPLTAVRTFGGYGPVFVTPSPVIMLPPMPPLLDFQTIETGKKRKKR